LSVDDILATWENLGAGGKRGHAQGKQGSSNLKAALHISLQNCPTIQAAIHKQRLGAGSREQAQMDPCINYGSLGG